MQLQDIAALTGRDSTFDLPELNRAQAYFEQGVRALKQVSTAQFADKPAYLQDAASAFVQMLKYTQIDIRPYLSLSYIFYVLDNFQVAQEYLNQASRIQGNHPLIERFQSAIHKGLEHKFQDAFEQSHFEKEHNLDFDALYEETEKKIHLIVRRLMETPFPEPVFADDHDVVLLKKAYSYYAQAYKQLRQNCAQLDQEIDTHGLRILLIPLEAHVARFKALLTFSERCTKLYLSLPEDMGQISQWIKKTRDALMPKDISQMESRLEYFLDRDDTVRREIFDLKQEGHNITILEHRYADFKLMIEIFMETIDATITRFERILPGG